MDVCLLSIKTCIANHPKNHRGSRLEGLKDAGLHEIQLSVPEVILFAAVISITGNRLLNS